LSSNITRYDAIYSLVGGPLIGSQDGTKMNYEGGQTPPTEAEIDAEMIRMQNEFQALQYQRDRKYPNLGEQFDLLFHDMNAGKADKTGKWYETISKVKSDNPK
tara:strand:+ start:112 stop:420 length:309 start_codon:yes stop_codon:yes gene_type:complete